MFGTTKITIAANLGDSRLFKPDNLTLEIDEPQSLFSKTKEKNSILQTLKFLTKNNLARYDEDSRRFESHSSPVT